MGHQSFSEKSQTRQVLQLVFDHLAAGSGVTLTRANGILTITATGGGGTVASVGVSTGTSGVPVTGSPVTGSGTIDLDLGTLANVDDAPADGSTYGRKNNAWVATGGGSSVQSPGCVFSNGNLLLTGTLTSEIQVPYGGTIEAWTIAGDAAGDASIIVSHSTYAAYPTMTTLFTATCTASNKAQATGLSHTLTAGDILRFSGSGFALFTRVSITLEVN